MQHRLFLPLHFDFVRLVRVFSLLFYQLALPSFSHPVSDKLYTDSSCAPLFVMIWQDLIVCVKIEFV